MPSNKNVRSRLFEISRNREKFSAFLFTKKGEATLEKFLYEIETKELKQIPSWVTFAAKVLSEEHSPMAGGRLLECLLEFDAKAVHAEIGRDILIEMLAKHWRSVRDYSAWRLMSNRWWKTTARAYVKRHGFDFSNHSYDDSLAWLTLKETHEHILEMVGKRVA